MKDRITILIPHYQTLDAIKLCLRSIRKYTSKDHPVWVLDNGSQDESIEYLKTLSWIRLVESPHPNDPAVSHFRCINDVLGEIETSSFLIMHSDVFVHHSGWLEFLQEKLLAGNHAAVGPCHKGISPRSAWMFWRFLRNFRPPEHKPGLPTLRSICALYKTEIFRETRAKFFSKEGEDITHSANEQLMKRGHTLLPLPSTTLRKFLFHSGSTTRIENRFGVKSTSKHLRDFEKFLRWPSTREILSDCSLDH